jgi:hypothetical protein
LAAALFFWVKLDRRQRRVLRLGRSEENDAPHRATIPIPSPTPQACAKFGLLSQRKLGRKHIDFLDSGRLSEQL